MEIFSIEFWLIFLIITNVIIVILFLRVLKIIKRKNAYENDKQLKDNNKFLKENTEKILNMIEPLLKDADKAAKIFDAQIREKNRIIKKFNEQLDNRIISIHLLLNRADAYLDNRINNQLTINDNRLKSSFEHDKIYEQQNTIWKLYDKGYDSEKIADELSMPKGEIDLVIELKNKLIKMEHEKS